MTQRWIETDGWAYFNGGSAKNVTIQNNYIHDTLGTIGIEHSGESFVENILIAGNVLEHCSNGTVTDGYSDSILTIKNVTISDNYILYNGYGFKRDVMELAYGDRAKKTMGYPAGSVSFGVHDYLHAGISITDNVFYLSDYALVTMGLSEENRLYFNGNTYVQNKNGIIVNPYMMNNYSWRYPLGGELFAINDEMFRYSVEEIIGDKNATILPLSEYPPDYIPPVLPEKTPETQASAPEQDQTSVEPAVEEPSIIGTIKITSGANVRSNPGTGDNAMVLGQVKIGETYEVFAIDAATGWYQFIWNGQNVWISAKMAEFTPAGN